MRGDLRVTPSSSMEILILRLNICEDEKMTEERFAY